MRRLILIVVLLAGTFVSAQPVGATHVSPSPPRCAKPFIIAKQPGVTGVPLGPDVVAYIRAEFDDCGTGEFFWLRLCPVTDGPMLHPLLRGDCLEFEGQAQLGQVGNMPSPGFRDIRLRDKHVGHGKWYFVFGLKLVGLLGWAEVKTDNFLVVRGG